MEKQTEEKLKELNDNTKAHLINQLPDDHIYVISNLVEAKEALCKAREATQRAAVAMLAIANTHDVLREAKKEMRAKTTTREYQALEIETINLIDSYKRALSKLVCEKP